MIFLKQSTAAVITFGPFVDKTDGVTLETGILSSLDHATTGIKLSKNGGTLTIRHQAVTASTYDAHGCYKVTLDTTDTNTLGYMRIIHEEAATYLPVWLDVMVVAANVWNSIYSGTEVLAVNPTYWGGAAIHTPGTAGVPIVEIHDPSGVTIGTVTNLTNAPTNGDLTTTMKSSVTTAATASTPALSTAGVNAIVTAVWAALTSALTTASSIGKKLADWVVGTIDTYTGNTKQTGNNYVASAKLDTTFEADGANYRFTTDSLANGPIMGVAITGALWTYTFTDADTSLPIESARILVSTDIDGVNIIREGITDVFGNVQFYLPAGNYYIWRYKDGYNPVNPDLEVVP